MSPPRALARPLLLAASLLVAVPALSTRPARAQDAESAAPAAQGGDSDTAPTARPKPKPKPAAPKPAAPKPAAKAAPAATPPATPAAATPAAAPAAVWPPGASTVSESYGDWTMTCTRPSEKVACIVAQSQGDAQTGRRKFGFELRTPRDGRSEGIVLMPFGLAIEPGVTFKLDEQALGKGAPYAYCNADGCIVSISFPTLALDGMRTAKTLSVTGKKPNGTEPATVNVPLAGFPQAFDRAVALGG